MKSPSPEAIKKARLKAGLTQKQAAELIGYSRRAWQTWESGGGPMRGLVFEAFRNEVMVKCGMIV